MSILCCFHGSSVFIVRMACANNLIRVARYSEDCLRNEEYSSSEIGAKRFIEPLCKADITFAAFSSNHPHDLQSASQNYYPRSPQNDLV